MKVEFIAQTSLHTSRIMIPIFLEKVSAGFPSPAGDYVEKALDLNELCIQHPAATFYVRVQGESMTEAGIYSNDILIVDRSLTAKQGDIIIANIFGEMTVKELVLKPKPLLIPRNRNYPPIPINKEIGLDIFGVVTGVVRTLRQT